MSTIERTLARKICAAALALIPSLARSEPPGAASAHEALAGALVRATAVAPPLTWKVGDRAEYAISAAVARGRARQFVREESADALWTQTDVDMGFLGRQKIEIEYDKATGRIRTLLVNGRRQEPPDPSDLDLIETRQETVRVPAGEFDSVYARMRSRRDGKIQEGWSNAAEVPMGGMIKAKGDAPVVGSVVQELQSFSFSPRAAGPRYLVLYKSPTTPQQGGKSKAESLRAMIAETAGAEARVFDGVERAPFDVRRPLWLLKGTIARLTPTEAVRIRLKDDVEDVIPLGRAAHLVSSVESRRVVGAGRYAYGLAKMRLPELNARWPELLGKSSRVGVIDTGVDPSHPDLRGKLAAFKDFVGKRQAAYDDHGHGTHVAGTILGGSASGVQIGVAPEASLIAAKAFGRHGGSDEADLLLAMQWMADPDGDPSTDDAPQTLSCSWNVDGDVASRDPAREPFCLAIDRLKALGIVSVFAAGNDGPNSSSILIPGACPESVTVGATDEDDRISMMSSRGPVRWRTGTFLKPDIVAPGVGIYSAAPGGGYTRRSGTSMATPHAAGALALLLHRQETSPQVERVKKLFASAFDLGPTGLDPAYGHGRVDLLQAFSGRE